MQQISNGKLLEWRLCLQDSFSLEELTADNIKQCDCSVGPIEKSSWRNSEIKNWRDKLENKSIDADCSGSPAFKQLAIIEYQTSIILSRLCKEPIWLNGNGS